MVSQSPIIRPEASVSHRDSHHGSFPSPDGQLVESVEVNIPLRPRRLIVKDSSEPAEHSNRDIVDLVGGGRPKRIGNFRGDIEYLPFHKNLMFELSHNREFISTNSDFNGKLKTAVRQWYRAMRNAGKPVLSGFPSAKLFIEHARAQLYREEREKELQDGGFQSKPKDYYATLTEVVYDELWIEHFKVPEKDLDMDVILSREPIDEIKMEAVSDILAERMKSGGEPKRQLGLADAFFIIDEAKHRAQKVRDALWKEHLEMFDPCGPEY